MVNLINCGLKNLHTYVDAGFTQSVQKGRNAEEQSILHDSRKNITPYLSSMYTHTPNREIFANSKFHKSAPNLVDRRICNYKLHESNHTLSILILWNVCRNIHDRKFAKITNIIGRKNFPI